jgi:hypothetical protein
MLLVVGRAPAADVDWKSLLSFYGDDTEFGGPYRDGETILGGQLQTYLEIAVNDRTSVLAGVYADRRSGGEKFLDPIDPILSFRYRTGASRFVLGTLITERRHGLLDPLEVSTLELTRPLESGLQWLLATKRVQTDFFLNWQKLNTPDHREVFDYGVVAKAPLGAGFSIEGQAHGLHHGGQLYDVGPVYNNIAWGPGIRYEHAVPIVGTFRAAAFRLGSSVSRDPVYRDRPTSGNGTLIRLGVSPWSRSELFLVDWRGHDFFAAEGDRNYASVGSDPSFYRADRKYRELGGSYRFASGPGVDFSTEARLHKIDDRQIEYSLRLLARVSLDHKLGSFRFNQ